ncbi:MAG: hypothetical protein IKO95_02900 [Spirochaetia bacterium]|nr:hypothetical protein [Spirochaetia bacterium]
MIKIDMKSRFFLLFAALMVFCVVDSHLLALEHDSGDKMTLPETTDFARKFNKFMEPISFGVGSEPGSEKNAVYIYLMYDYAPTYSWMVKFDLESSVTSDSDIDLDGDEFGFQLDKQKTYTLDILPMVRHFEYLDLGVGVMGQYLRYDLEGLESYGTSKNYYDVRRDVFQVGPLLYLHWQYPIAKHVDLGGTTEFSPCLWTTLHDKFHVTNYDETGKNKYSSTEKDYGFGAPVVSQLFYLTFIKFINLSTSIDYSYYRIGTHDVQTAHDTVLRFGLSILKRPKSGFLNYLVGVFYENEWYSIDINHDNTYEHKQRWIFCIGASG